MAIDDTAREQLQALGEFIKAQRQLAQLSLRELAARTSVSNPYLSQIERGLHEPSVRVLKAIANALNVSAETLLQQAGLLDEDAEGAEGSKSRGKVTTESAIRADTSLTDEQKQALLSMYRVLRDQS